MDQKWQCAMCVAKKQSAPYRVLVTYVNAPAVCVRHSHVSASARTKRSSQLSGRATISVAEQQAGTDRACDKGHPRDARD